MRRSLRPFLVFLLLWAAGPMPPARAAQDPLDALLAAVGREPGSVTLPAVAPARRGLPLVEAMRARPLEALARAGGLEADLFGARQAPSALVEVGADLLDAPVAGPDGADSDLERLRSADDPLALALAELADAFGTVEAATLPGPERLPRPLRIGIGRVLLAAGRAEQLRRRALAPLPAGMSRPLALRQALTGRWGEGGAPDLRQALVDVDRASLAAGLQVLAAALAGLRDALAQAHAAAGLVWEAETALGRVLIDLGTTDDARSLVAPLLLVDGGGDDRYHFLDDTRRPAIALLLDLAGRDHYASAAPAAGVAVGLLGYGLLWDAGRDDDRYDGADLDQAAAVLGGAVLVDEGGNDHYAARGHAQAFALGGLAVLLDRAGDDRYEALTFAQASAGPAAVALLVDAAGDDRYRLAAEPLVAPSAQRPDLNVSAGQGMGIGIRADHLDGRSLAGGLGVLLDGGGDDDYQATVFAQGAGYWRGGGLLFDRGGQDHYQAIWYGQAAAAHAGLGLLIDRGGASDRYQASQSTSMAAAHDGALAMLLDEGGDDDYRLGDLGLGAAHDTGVALFADLDGDDRYAVSSEACRAFGAAIAEQPDGPAAVPNLGLFMDLGGTDRYGCGLARNDQRWTWPGGGDGAGFDGVAPFRLETGTDPAPAGPAAPPRPWREDPRGRSWP